MFIVIACMCSGILVGFLTKGKPFKYTQPILTFLIWALLFLLGISVGSNQRVMNSLTSIGLEALLITVMATLGSCLAAKVLLMYLNRKKK
ncbi:MAG: LysO family transporter [Phocaeicola sp.]|uniref:LysO family transporter n=1 Tax=Phocaeicola sp. TaxID=2773926 RepID=UPI003FA13901